MNTLFPADLPDDLFQLLSQYQKEAEELSPDMLLEKSKLYISDAQKAYNENPLIVNLPLAEALHDSIVTLINNWDNVPGNAQSWCKAMILYFTKTDDNDHDFKSPLGFDDDAEVINACLKFAGHENLCVDPEEIDNE